MGGSFDRGGHSWLDVRLFTRVEHVVGASVPLTDFLQAPTVEQLAHILGAESTQAASLPRKFEPGDSRPMQDTILTGLKNRLFQVLAQYAVKFRP